MKLLKKTSVIACVAALTMGTSFNAQAFGFGDMGSAFGGGSASTASVDGAKYVESSKRMVSHYVIAMTAMNYAQAEALDAFGLADKAEEARQAASAYEGGVVDGDEGNKLIESSLARDEMIMEYINKNEKLGSKASEHLSKSAISYAGASYAGVLILKDIKDWASGAKDVMKSMKTDPMKLSSFTSDTEAGFYVISKLPDLVSKWSSTSSSLISYAETNGAEIDTRDEKERIASKLALETT